MLIALDRFTIVLGMFSTLVFLTLFLFFCTSSISTLSTTVAVDGGDVPLLPLSSSSSDPLLTAVVASGGDVSTFG